MTKKPGVLKQFSTTTQRKLISSARIENQLGGQSIKSVVVENCFDLFLFGIDSATYIDSRKSRVNAKQNQLLPVFLSFKIPLWHANCFAA